MKNYSVQKYCEILNNKRVYLFIKRIFDIVIAIFTLIILFPIFIIVSIVIKIDSKGPIIFRQVRVTQYGKPFKIFKFRTMVNNAEKFGTQVTIKDDARVTKFGKTLRKYRLDEFPQLFDIILGDMSFVGSRPEVIKYVERYTDEMMVTLLLPAGVTSEASIRYKDEERILNVAKDADKLYLEVVLPEKMKYNLRSFESFSFWGDIKTMVRTILVFMKYNQKNAGNNLKNGDKI